MNKKSKIFNISMWCSLAVILLGFLIVFIIWRRDVTQSLNVHISNDPIEDFEAEFVHESSHDPVDIYIYPSKSWENPDDVGAQYDGYITNQSVATYYNWELKIYLDEPGVIDSSWNGTFDMEDQTITVKPDENTNYINPDNTSTFGFVMNSRHLQDIREFDYIGHRFSKITDYPMFWVFVVLMGMWLIFVFTTGVVHIRTAKLKEQKIHDDKVIDETMQTFARIIDVKDESTRGHSIRVSYYSKLLAKEMGMDEEEIRKIGHIGLVHDCGKIGVPDLVLNKAGALTEAERNEMKKHTVYGGKILDGFEAIESIRDGALYHHERYDGKGYPHGLKGEEIPIYARIINIADAFDAMNSDRCYRKHLSKEKILEELENNSGTQFDPEIVSHMIKMVKDGLIETMREKGDNF